MGEDSGNHRRIFDVCPEPVEGAAMIFKAPAQFGQCSMSIPSAGIYIVETLVGSLADGDKWAVNASLTRDGDLDLN